MHFLDDMSAMKQEAALRGVPLYTQDRADVVEPHRWRDSAPFTTPFTKFPSTVLPPPGIVTNDLSEQPFSQLEVGERCMVRKWLPEVCEWTRWQGGEVEEKHVSLTAGGNGVWTYIVRTFSDQSASQYIPVLGEIWANGCQKPSLDTSPYRRTRTLMNAVYAPFETVVILPNGSTATKTVYFPALYMDMVYTACESKMQVRFLDGPNRGQLFAVDHRFPLNSMTAHVLDQWGYLVYKFSDVVVSPGTPGKCPWNFRLEGDEALVFCQKTLRQLEEILRHGVKVKQHLRVVLKS
ncbi:hypothetical protein OBBRIDRAFT_891272 [Obba rivulosa]|uniref:Uncharacterized protein n=1 Tax=Obba rivulosa TaxID=1052685 RepID=A0A8E2DGX1_9APHY|nr:hypothetical protein OBBRIDRAFT_891272 [Obba rivulosa]